MSPCDQTHLLSGLSTSDHAPDGYIAVRNEYLATADKFTASIEMEDAAIEGYHVNRTGLLPLAALATGAAGTTAAKER